MRVCVWQNGKPRCIDNGRSSQHNEGQHEREKIHHCPVEFVVNVAAEMVRGLPAPWPEWAQVGAGVDDLKDAYRGCPTSDDSAVQVSEADA